MASAGGWPEWGEYDVADVVVPRTSALDLPEGDAHVHADPRRRRLECLQALAWIADGVPARECGHCGRITLPPPSAVSTAWLLLEMPTIAAVASPRTTRMRFMTGPFEESNRIAGRYFCSSQLDLWSAQKSNGRGRVSLRPNNRASGKPA